jgi:methionyl-tRNA synthetase
MLQGGKFSKSRGWYISLRDYLNNFPADYLRYYLAAITPNNQSDVNFDWDEFYSRINNELVANIGNFIYRTMNFTSSRYQGIIPSPHDFDELDNIFQDEITQIRENVENHLKKNEFDRALKKIIEFSGSCNRYFQNKEPWKGKEGNQNCIYLSINAVKTIAILLDPYLRNSIDNLWNQLNMKEERIWNSASVIDIPPNHKINKPSILFRKIDYTEINKQKKLLRTN